MKKFVTYAIAGIFLSVLGVEEPKIISSVADKSCYLPGERVKVTLKYTQSDGGELSAYAFRAYKHKLPKACAQLFDFPKGGKNTCWDMAMLRKWSYPGAVAKARPNYKNTFTVELPIAANWPDGDYAVEVGTLFKDTRYQKGKKRTELKGERYIYTPIVFSVSGRAAAEKADAKGGNKIIAYRNYTVKTADFDRDTVWCDLPWHDKFTLCGDRKRVADDSRFKLYHNNEKLFILLECDERQPDQLKINMPRIWQDDTVEISIVTAKNNDKFFKAIVNADGKILAFDLVDDNTGTRRYASNVSHVKVDAAGKVAGKKYQALVIIDLPSLDWRELHGNKIALNVSRNQMSGAKAVYSSYAPLSIPGHNAPWDFKKFELANFNPTSKHFAVKCDSLKLEVTGDKYVATAVFEVENLSGSFAVGSLVWQLSGGDRKYTSIRTMETPDGKPSKITLKLDNVQPGEYLSAIEFLALDGTVRKRAVQPVTLKYLPLTLEIKKPIYKNAIFSTQDDKTFSVVVHVKKPDGTPIEILFEGGNTKIKKIEKTRGGKLYFSCDMANMPDGNYHFSAKLAQKDIHAKDLKAVIRKLPFKANEVYVSPQRGIVAGGKTFVPLGFFAPALKSIDNCNIMVTYAHRNTPEAWVKFLDKAHAAGKKVILQPYCENNGQWAWTLFKDHKRFTAEQGALITQLVNSIKDHPALFGYYLADEPEGRVDYEQWYGSVHQLLDKLDPHHPTIMLNYSIHGMKRFGVECDLLFPDPYPNYYTDSSTYRPVAEITQLCEYANAHKPYLVCLQGFAWRSYDKGKVARAPNFTELRNNFYQAVAHDARGILYFIWEHLDTVASLRRGIPHLGDELTKISKYIPVKSMALKAKTTPEKASFVSMLKKYGKDMMIIAVNNHPGEVKSQLTLPGKYNGTLYVLGEKRQVEVKNGNLTDNFPRYAAHVYLTDRKLAEAVSLAETGKQIASDIADTRRKGNYLGYGEIPDEIIRKLLKGELPDYPVLRSSSHLPAGKYSENGTVYFLMDGRREITTPVPAWSPNPSDRKPWIAITLPRSEKVSCFQLYTNKHNDKAVLISGEISYQRDGKWIKWQRFKNNQQSEIIVTAPPENASKWKLDITEYLLVPKIANQEFIVDGIAVTSRVLNEIEIY